MRFLEDIFDLVAGLLLMGLTITTSFSIILPIFYEDKYQVGFIDKTSQQNLGYELEEDYDGTFGYLDVVLATQIQDFNLPEPKQFTVATESPKIFLVDGTYNSAYNLDKVKTDIVELLNKEGTYDSRYRLRHNFGLSSSNSTNLVTNGDMESPIVDFVGSDSPWKLIASSSDSSASQITGSDVIMGTRSIMLTSPKGTDRSFFYQTIGTALPNTKYHVAADVYCTNCSAYIEVIRYFEDGSVGEPLRSEMVTNTTKMTSQRLLIDFLVASNISRFDINIVKETNLDSNLPEKMVVDNVEFRAYENSDPYYEFYRVR